MAATDKDIVISPQRGSATLQPSIVFTGDGNDPLTLRVLDSATGSLSIEGSAGQLFGVSNNLASGSVFSANYASGIPAIDVNASGVVSLVPTVGKVGIGTTNPQSKIHINAETGTASTGASVGVIGKRLSFNNSTSDAYGALNIGDWNTLGQRVIVSISSRQSGGTGAQYYENGGEIATLRFTGTGTDSASGMVASEITASSSGSGFGNTNTSPSDLIFRVSGSEGTRTVPVERLRIAGSGNVGIGTANPSTKLQVEGTIWARGGGSFRAYRTDNSRYGAVYHSTDGVFLEAPVSGDNAYVRSVNNSVILRTGTTDRLIVLNNGNVGIGTTNQTSKLAVNGFITESTDGGTNYWNVVTQQDIGTSPNQVPLNQYLGQLAFMDDFSPNGLRREGGSTDDVVVNSVGNVGIGTTNPDSLLHISGNINLNSKKVAHFISNDGSPGDTAVVQITRLDNQVVPTSPDNACLVLQEHTSNYVLHAKNHSGTGLFSIKGSGNVGIGVTNPQKPLEVIVPQADYASIGVRQMALGEWTGIHFGYRENNTAYRKSVLAFERIDDAARGKIHILNNNDNNANSATLSDSRLTIQSDGNVGIGITNPAYKLHVYGVGAGVKIGPTYSPSDRDNIILQTGGQESYIRGNNEEFGFYNNAGDFVFHADSLEDASTNPERFRIGADGHVGIGTVIDIVPYDTLNNGTLSWEGSAGQLFSITNNLTSGSIFSVNDVSGIPSIDVDANGTIELAPFGGNVGIGTTNPASKLHVSGGSYRSSTVLLSDPGSYAITVESATGAYTSGYIGHNIGFRSNSGQNNGRGRIVAAINTIDEGTQDASGLMFCTANTSEVLNEHVRVTSSGNVGIGTINPSSKLHVIGPVSSGTETSPQVLVRDANNGMRAFEFYFSVIKPTALGTASNVNLISVTSLPNFHQAIFTIEYGTRLQNVSDSTTSVCLKQFGVNRFNGGNVAITDTNDIASDTNSNTHANVTCVATASNSYVIRIEFSSSIAASSFCSGVIRGIGVEDTFQTISFFKGSGN